MTDPTEQVDTFDLLDPDAEDPDSTEVTEPTDPSWVAPTYAVPGQGDLDPGTEETL